MNETEARTILGLELSRYRERSYNELLSLVDDGETVERISLTGVIYQIEMQVFFDDELRRSLRVLGAIDDGGWRALKPLCDGFILAPDGTFIDD